MTERSLFLAVLEIDDLPERHAYLDRACAGDPALRSQIEELLQAHQQPGHFMEQPAPVLVANSDEMIAERPGTLIGPYKLLEQIGEGGFGAVFMAEQLEPVRRTVALKVIKPGMDSKQVVARFEAERQALAMMDHPNIAKVLGAGATDAGRPYFVMELVRGIPITDYCDQAGFSVRVRLQLFVQVCRAVQHAHTKGVIHRDLKPGNVLVTSHDGVPVPYVIDFGVAKALGQQLSERSVHTGFAQLIGTPLYMSPEQAELNELGVDTRSDIYSLGVLLYELLTGATPFDKERLRTADFDEMRRILREEEPPRPSTRLSTLGAALSTVSERRGIDPRKLTQTLQGELDWIVLKALDKDRARRYETASAFAADVERYLNDEPVEACPPSAGYRLRKYLRRNRRSLATVGLIATALVAATAVSVWQAVKARDAQNQAESDTRLAKTAQRETAAAEKRAITEADIARAVNDFLQKDVLAVAGSDPQLGQNNGDNPYLTVREALDRAAARIDDRFHDQPLVEAAIRTVIGTAYNNLSEHQLAERHLDRAVALRQAHLGHDHPDTLESMGQLAAARERCGRFAEAISLRRQLLEGCQARLGPDSTQTLRCVNDLAWAHSIAGQWDKSEQLWEWLLDKQRATGAPETAMHSLACNYAFQGRLAESLALHAKILEAEKAKGSLDRGELAWLLTTFAGACQRAKDFNRADLLYREALEQCRKHADSYKTRRLTATALCFWAQNLFLQGRYDEAEPVIRKALLFYEKVQPDDPQRFLWMNLLGAVLAGQQRYPEAEPLLLRGYEEFKKGQVLMDANCRTRLPQAGERVVHFYEVTNQPEKAREWREKLSAMK